MRGSLSNEYARLLRDYQDIPKAVLAAIAVSALTCGGDHLDEANERLAKEWDILYAEGIVPQKRRGK